MEDIKDTKGMAQAYLQSCEKRGLSPNSVRAYRSFLKRFEESYPVLPMGSTIIESFIAFYRSSDERRHVAYRTLRAFYNWIEKKTDKFDNPIKRTIPPIVRGKEKPYLDLEQTRCLLEHPDHPYDIAVLLLLLTDTGLSIETGNCVALLTLSYLRAVRRIVKMF